MTNKDITIESLSETIRRQKKIIKNCQKAVKQYQDSYDDVMKNWSEMIRKYTECKEKLHYVECDLDKYKNELEDTRSSYAKEIDELKAEQDAGAGYPAYLCKAEGELSGPEHFFDHMEPDYLSFSDPARKIRDYCKDRVWCFDNKSICKYFINRKCILRNYIKGGCNPCDLYPWECEIIDKARGLKE